MAYQIPILVSQTIYVVSGSMDVASLAGLMQVQQQAFSNQLTLHICIISGIAAAFSALAATIGFFGYQEIKKTVTKKAVDIARDTAQDWIRDYTQNFMATLVDEDGKTPNNTAIKTDEKKKFNLVRKGGE